MHKNNTYSESVRRALDAKFAIIHVMGPRGGESSESIITRKIEDFTVRGSPITFWSQHSRLACHDQVRSLCEKGEAYLYLVANRVARARQVTGEAPEYKLSGQQTTGKYRTAFFYNQGDRSDASGWILIDERIKNVGDQMKRLDQGKGLALVLGRIEILTPPALLRMNEWANVAGSTPVPARTSQGAHAVCAERRDMSWHPEVWMKEKVIIAVAPLRPPFSVWLR